MKNKQYKIAIAGTSCVGLSNAMLLAQYNELVVLDIVTGKVELPNRKQFPIVNAEISDFLQNKDPSFTATVSREEVYIGADYVVIATPTDYDEEPNHFNTKSVEVVIQDVMDVNPNAVIFIESTVPVGCIVRIKQGLSCENIISSLEFFREGKVLYGGLNLSKIIAGERAETFACLLAQSAEKENIDTLFMESTGAEVIKLFSNTFLAMWVAYLNELDTHAESHGLNAK